MTEDQFEHQLEQLRRSAHPAPPGLAARIIASTSTRQQDPLSWLIGWLRRSPLQGTLAALCPLAIGFAIGVAVEVNGSAFDAEGNYDLAIFDVYEEYAPLEDTGYEI